MPGHHLLQKITPFKVHSHSLSSCKNLLHTTFWYVQLFCSYSKTSCMKHRQFSIKICHSSCIYCNSVCSGDSKLRELSLNHTVSSPLGSGSGRVKCETIFCLLLRVRQGGFSWEYQGNYVVKIFLLLISISGSVIGNKNLYR